MLVTTIDKVTIMKKIDKVAEPYLIDAPAFSQNLPIGESVEK